jgi:hypothetical protein
MAFRSMDRSPAQRFEDFLNFVSFAEDLARAKPVAS